ncbi:MULTISPECIES: pyridoxal 5'-phosphate synthase glutaminase subunit PdxT [Methanoculleus]|uniref:Pyridoxal 5'-phosphate synthase subunit PdxT n=2 Tax=Methanoculleus TaxID=45989 RepID=PDXT_METMJ|nr:MULTISPECIES: pyridoxal 5'-phosphate synthase glutaminase subunit PdxT [Methanoculleus]A3CRE5.1 RecName: Full=Pyridoxal 5'-phosphate synthase subunit PdxT; AltName: Full=Pdx2; AltName: Full=Pyridoxal 5'-phosphate synthase glutaminase subunit [Methanoculleus marisnigri JR1]ABN55945.1 pyridoxal phosphate synthase yaaE subunit [Methanoculleus marisnigri JR1]MCC7555052.1 pyridoxal 5'-phosphate synthase glutaminase subunit PdxT [Methanoculleus marisnigri]UYU17431.1 pyridoxal 5'-phosphate synthase
MGVKVGVLALQGDVAEHIAAFREALAERPGSSVAPIRRAEDLADLDALAIPGGESTTISRLMGKNGLYEPVAEFEGGVFATCAGMVLSADRVDDPRVRPLSLIPMHVARNAFGRQVDSRETMLEVAGLAEPFRAVFIRAPVATEAGDGVEVLARIPEGIVAVRHGRHMAFAFHPELGGDLRLHRVFLEGLEV